MILPRKETLKKYGLSLADWLEMYHLQNGLCPLCEKPLDVRICVDHYHVRGFKNMLPEKKRLYVRGLLHWFCNRYYLGRSMTLKKARNVVAYLERFEKKLQDNK